MKNPKSELQKAGRAARRKVVRLGPLLGLFPDDDDVDENMSKRSRAARASKNQAKSLAFGQQSGSLILACGRGGNRTRNPGLSRRRVYQLTYAPICLPRPGVVLL